MSIIDKIDNITEARDNRGVLTKRIDFEKIVKKIKGMTARNDHIGAYILISSEILKNKKLVKIFTAIDDITNVDNGMSMNLSNFRYEKYQEMLNQVKAKLDDQDYQAVYQST